MEKYDGDIVYFGRTCARRNSGKSESAINSEIKAYEKEKRDAATKDVKNTKEYAEYKQKMAEREALGCLPGKQAMEFIYPYSTALNNITKEISKKYNLKYLIVY